MITAEFDYQAPDNLSRILELIETNAEHAKILGGGMTLVPMLNLGLAAPNLIIGLRRVLELKGIRECDDRVLIGATTTHHAVSNDPLIRQYVPLLGLAAGLIGDVQVRNRGTIGGSLAHADPAANYLPAVIALDAIIELAGPAGRRAIPAKDFFRDVMTTLLEDDEIIACVSIPKITRKRGYGFQKFTRVKGNFPIVCAASVVDCVNGSGRLVVGGVTPVPIVIEFVAGNADDIRKTEVSNSIRAAITNPLEDHNGDAEYKREMAVVFGWRALADAFVNAGGKDN